MIGTRAMTMACGLLAMLGAASARAQTPDPLPPLDIVVYIDGSKSIYQETDQSPNTKIIEMLENLFALDVVPGRKFASEKDSVYIYLFNNKVFPVEGFPTDGAVPLPRLNEALKKLKDSNYRPKIITKDSTSGAAWNKKRTDFASLFDTVKGGPIFSRSSDRQKILIIASDFIHDPEDTPDVMCADIESSVRDGIPSFRTREQSNFSASFSAFNAAFKKYAEGSKKNVSFTILSMDDETLAQTYRDAVPNNCVTKWISEGPIQKALAEGPIHAHRASYKNDTPKDIAVGVQLDVFKAMLPPLAVTNPTAQVKSGTVNVKFTVDNIRGRIANEIHNIRIGQDPDNTPFTVKIDPQKIAAGRKETIEFNVDSTEAKEILRSRSAYVSFDDDSRLPRQPPVRINVDDETSLEIREVSRKGGSCRDVDVKVTNPQEPAKTPGKVYFFFGREGPNVATANPNDSGAIAASELKTLTIPIPSALLAVAAHGGLWFSLGSGTNNRVETDRSRIESMSIPSVTPEGVPKWELRDATARLEIDLRNNGDCPVQIGRVALKSGSGDSANCTLVNGPVTLPAKSVEPVVCERDVADAIFEAVSPQVELFDPAERPLLRSALDAGSPRTQGIDIDPTGSALEFPEGEPPRLALRLRNPVAMENRAIGVWVRNATKNAEPDFIPFGKEIRVAARQSEPTIVPVKPSPNLSLASDKSVALSVAVRDMVRGTPPSDSGKEWTEIRSRGAPAFPRIEWSEWDKAKPSLALRIRNPGGVRQTPVKVELAQSQAGLNALTIDLAGETGSGIPLELNDVILVTSSVAKLDDAAQRLFAGQPRLWVCISEVVDGNAAKVPNTLKASRSCGPNDRIEIAGPPQPRVTVTPELRNGIAHDFKGTVNLKLTNESEWRVPVLGVNVFPLDGRDPIYVEFSPPVEVGAGGEKSATIRLRDDQWKRVFSPTGIRMAENATVRPGQLAGDPAMKTVESIAVKVDGSWVQVLPDPQRNIAALTMVRLTRSSANPQTFKVTARLMDQEKRPIMEKRSDPEVQMCGAICDIPILFKPISKDVVSNNSLLYVEARVDDSVVSDVGVVTRSWMDVVLIAMGAILLFVIVVCFLMYLFVKRCPNYMGNMFPKLEIISENEFASLIGKVTKTLRYWKAIFPTSISVIIMPVVLKLVEFANWMMISLAGLCFCFTYFAAERVVGNIHASKVERYADKSEPIEMVSTIRRFRILRMTYSFIAAVIVSFLTVFTTGSVESWVFISLWQFRW